MACKATMSEEADEEICNTNLGVGEDELKKTRPPNRKKFDEEMDRLLSQIKEKEAELESLKTSGGTTTNELKNLKAEKIATIARRKQIDADLDKLNREIPEKMRHLNQLQSSLYYQSEEKINTAIQRLEWNLKVQTFKLMEEKKIVAEIDSLKRSKKTLVQYLTLKQEINGIRDMQRRMRNERDTYFRAVTNLKHQEEKLRKNSSSSRGRFAEVKREIDELYEKKRQLLANYKKQKEEFHEVKEKQRQESLRKREDNRKTIVEDRRLQQAEVEPEKPFEKQIKLCNALLKYLSQFNSLPLQEPSVDSLSPASSLDEPELAEEIDDGQFVLLKKSGEFEGLDYSGGARRLSKKNKRPRKQSVMKKMKHSTVTIEQFEELGLTAPTSISEVPATVESLHAKKAFFEREQQPNEAASDAGISATESTICEMSRQASKTESCEGAVDTHPGDQVYADLLQGCQDGHQDLPEDLEEKGAVGGCEDNSDILSPNSDSTVEGDNGSSESQSSVGAASSHHRSERNAIRYIASTTVPDSWEGGEAKRPVPPSSIGWPHSQLGAHIEHPFARHQSDTVSARFRPEENQCVDCSKLEESKPAWHSDCRPKSKYLNPSDLPPTHRWGKGGEKSAKTHKPVVPAQPEEQDLSITSPLEFPSLEASTPPKRVIGSPVMDRSIRESLGDSTKSLSMYSDRSPVSSPLSPRQGRHQSLAARLSSPPSAAIPPAKKKVTQTLSVPTQSLSQPMPLLNNEDFPPLSQTASSPRRGSSLSTKSSSDSSMTQEQGLQVASTPSDLHVMAVTDKLISTLDISGQSTVLGGNPALGPQQMYNVGTAEESPYPPSHLLPELPLTDPVSMSQIPKVDKSSTEKWVESSVAFTKDFSPVPCEDPISAPLSETTRL